MPNANFAEPSNPYLIKSPSKSDMWLFCNRHEELRELFSYIREGIPTTVIGQRKIGKTFLLRLVEQLIQDGLVNGRLCEQDFVDTALTDVLTTCLAEAGRLECVYVTLERTTSIGQAYAYILRKIDEQKLFQKAFIDGRTALGITIKEGEEGISELTFGDQIEDLSNRLTKNSVRLVLLIDEFERVLKHGERAGDFFKTMRDLGDQYSSSLSVVLAGARIIPAEFPQLNALTLKRFSSAQYNVLRQLIQEPARNHLSFEPEVVERIIELSGGHPFLLQSLCYIAFSESTKRSSDSPVVINPEVLDEVVDELCKDEKPDLGGPLNAVFGDNYSRYLDDKTAEVQKAIIRILLHCNTVSRRMLEDNLAQVGDVDLGVGDVDLGLKHLQVLDKISCDNQDPPNYQLDGELLHRWLPSYGPYRRPLFQSQSKVQIRAFEYVLTHPGCSEKEIADHVKSSRLGALLRWGQGRAVVQDLLAKGIIEPVKGIHPRYRICHRILIGKEYDRLASSSQANRRWVQVSAAIVMVILLGGMFLAQNLSVPRGHPHVAIVDVNGNLVPLRNADVGTRDKADALIWFHYPKRVRPGQINDPIVVEIKGQKGSHERITIDLAQQEDGVLEIIGEKKAVGFSGPFIEHDLSASPVDVAELAIRLRQSEGLPKQINLDVKMALDGQDLRTLQELLVMEVDRLGPILEILQGVLTFLFGTGVGGFVVAWLRKEEQE